MVHHERVCAVQRHTLSVTRIQSHEGFTAPDLCWIARKSIPKLEHRIGSDRVEAPSTRPARPCLTMSKKGSSAEYAA
jgi:hypothetical protein